MFQHAVPTPPASLQKEEDLRTYLRSVVSHVQSAARSAEVAVYLLDPATRRLRLKAWAAHSRSGSATGPDTPHDLTDHGIEGADLTAGTLRDFVNAAPERKRVARALHDGESWVGALIAVADEAFVGEDIDRIAASARDLGEVLRPGETAVSSVRISDPESDVDLPSEPIYGHGASDGLVYAPALLYDTDALRGYSAEDADESRESALERLNSAIAKTRSDLETLTGDTGSDLYDVVSLLFSTHVLMLSDEAFSGAMRSLVTAGDTPEEAVQSVVASFVTTFGKLREARLAEKAQDVRDIGYRLLQNLDKRRSEAQDFTNRIVLAEDVLPSDLIRLALGHASGMVLFGATVTAHISILAESLGLPAMVTADRTALEIVNDTMLLLDAEAGKLLASPTAEQLAGYGLGAGAGPSRSPTDDTVNLRPGRQRHEMADGEPVTLLVNVNLLGDARRGIAGGANGIGLYRSEFPFIVRNDFISEDEQYRIYRAVVRSAPGMPVTLRTADIGGDKLMAGREEERNPFLGVRGIRFSLANREFFRYQLRAMLRAGAGAELGILFPMVASHDELEDAQEELQLCLDSLRRDGLEHNEHPLVGAMIELPSAVIDIEELARRTDFLSVGTNDLIMYLLAVDRTNERLSELYRSHHPIVLRTLAEITRRIDPVADSVSVCGESASDPIMVPFYLGIGIRKLSVAPRKVRFVAETARRYSVQQCEHYANELLAVPSIRDMDSFLKGRNGTAPG